MAPSAIINSTAPAINGHSLTIPRRLFSLSSPPSLSTLQKLTSQTTSAATYPLAAEVTSNIPIYDLTSYSPSYDTSAEVLQDEWNHILLSGPGVFILKNFLPNPSLISTVNDTFSSITQKERASSTSRGDHFAAAGSNSRIWNSFQKHALANPSSFVSYYSNPWLFLVSESYLGPAYQITAQVNIVHPGGKPQFCHRDYHLGFQTAESSAQFPRAIHKASSLLTLQGAIAHSDMPLDSGPTRFLPFSQQLEEGFMAYRLPEFSSFFEEHCISLPLSQGDAVFFNPALFHAAGENKSTDIERSANLLQISSAFGRTMESIDTQAIVEATWPSVVEMYEREGMSLEVECAIKAIADGYPFPTNLDRRPPAPGGMAPESEREMLVRALKEGREVRETVEGVRTIRLESLP